MIVYEKHVGAINLFGRAYGSALPRSMVLAVPVGMLTMFLQWDVPTREYLRAVQRHPNALMVVGTLLGIIIALRTNLSYARYWEGRTMVAQMSSKWSDASIQVVAFDEAATGEPAEHGIKFRAEFVHLMSLMHALAMQKLRGDSDINNLSVGSLVDIPTPKPSPDPGDVEEWYKCISLWDYFSLFPAKRHMKTYRRIFSLPVLGGISPEEREVLSQTEDRVHCVHCWLHRSLVARRMEGGIKVDAPVVSRIYQVLSDGMLGFENSYKLANTPFPFPYAQCITVFIYAVAFLITPALAVGWIDSLWMSGLVAFLMVLGYDMLNEVARDLEEPFRFDPNELPVWLFHHRFNARLVTTLCKSLMPEVGITRHLDSGLIHKQVQDSRPAIKYNQVFEDCTGSPLPHRKCRTGSLVVHSDRTGSAAQEDRCDRDGGREEDRREDVNEKEQESEYQGVDGEKPEKRRRSSPTQWCRPLLSPQPHPHPHRPSSPRATRSYAV
ncbi:hypothetical protein CBR_g48487 [Chara braunii]|uniref:Bestrophin homolog n=1 Tax=Chara braunii TaxID=69332 RepID=A0A388M2Z3_CHABU|nr:hypothetical protein CBR_g48487 [Chara braunii]|eukprot:GBG88875.1 hypothetical protein CBR_g48487 [Chara braunii]